jgi:pullulanase-type alpha-1,6-glucosidase
MAYRLNFYTLRPARRLALALIVALLTLSAVLPRGFTAQAAPAAQADLMVVVPGTIQSKLGCDADWKPDCTKTQLTYDAANGLYRGTFELPAGSYEYKVAIGGSWNENYGLKAKPGGANIPLKLTETKKVTFLWDPVTKYVTDTVNTPITVVMGDIQAKLGCAADNAPDCLKTWMRDLTGEGIYSFTTTKLPKGDYKVTVAFDEDKTKTVGDPVAFTVAADSDEIYFEYNAPKKVFKVYPGGAPRGDLSTALAVWAREDVILWKLKDNSDKNSYFLHYDPTGAMTLTPQGITGGERVPLKLLALGINLNEIRAPYLKGYDSLQIAIADRAKIPAMLRGQLIVSAVGPNGKLIDATSVQVWGALDSLFRYDGPLGATFLNSKPSIRVWAPTAKSVTLHLYDGPTTTADTAIPMRYSANTGVWTANLDADANGKYYLFEVEVYVRTANKVERNFVTDPYSLNLSMNSTRSQIVDLSDPALMPAGWAAVKKPPLAAPEDAVIYELHVRDFSIQDQTVPEALRGTFKAFTVADSNGMKHLKALAAAGLTHVHLLPTFDIATIEEDKTKRQAPDWAALGKLPADGEEQQAAVARTKSSDGFNWGYDPYHYTTPEGSYSTDPNGPARIIEFRQMVAALNAAGLRVVMDVVYNHTTASGQADKSVLDKIVPGYYYRLNLEGAVENSTCCANTATEHRMMEKLMIDSLRTWATAYKVDGYRFDLMGHHMVYNMDAVRAMLDGLTPAADGVDGKAIYIYGEGWNFGEVANNARGKNATQANMAGTGIGTFNDRLRDGVRGGSPFSDQRDQGFATGLFTDPSAYTTKATPTADQKKGLLADTALIQIGLAGNLSAYKLVDPTGKEIRGVDIDYNGAPAGYTSDPQENIVYASAHDNQTIFDAIQLKAPATADLAARIRMNNLANDLVMFAQGIPFFHAGDELLRSKSLDRNSYDSGDWFNVLDFSMATSGWGRGLPPASENQTNWPIMKPLLADPTLRPTTTDIQFAADHFIESLKIRKSSALFRLRTAEDIENRLSFFNVGPDQIPGVIALRITDNGDALLDPAYIQVVVIFNATPTAQTITEKKFSGLALTLHPVQAASVDPVVRTASFDPATAAFTIPARTAAVFVLPRR